MKEESMKVYKFRSLGDCHSLERAEEILRTGEFWCSRFWEMNDPMEGYYLRTSELAGDAVSQIFNEKSQTLICSFSKVGAMSRPSMWGYYANGFKGVAIEVEITRNLHCVEYSDDLIKVDGEENGLVKRILSRKLKCWSQEEEVRVFRLGNSRALDLGKITGAVIATSYPKTVVNPDVDGRRAKMTAYNCRVDHIKQLCREKKIPIRRARMKNGQVEIENWNDE